MPKRHTAKQIKGLVHPRSRKAGQLDRAGLREVKLRRQKQQTANQKYLPIVARLTWFQGRLQPELHEFSIEQIYELIESYIQRCQPELEELLAAERPGRPQSPRIDQIRFQQQSEAAEYQAGMDLPDLGDKTTYSLLK